jgi:hypothetical protein
MTSIVRRTAAMLLLLAAGGLLAACGKSAHFAAGKRATGKASGETSAHTGQPLTRARAKRLAAALNLQAGDLPGFTAASEHKRESLSEKGLEHKLMRCMGGKISSGALAEASSKSFERHAQVFHVSVSSSVTIVATPAQAAAELKAIRSDRARVCLTRFVRELLAEQTHGHASAKLVSVTKASPSAEGTSGTFAWRIAGEFALHEVQVPFYIELVGFAHGQAEVELLSFGLPAPFPASAEQELFSLLLARAKAGGAGKAGKRIRPPNTPSLSGPRRVQISL